MRSWRRCCGRNWDWESLDTVSIVATLDIPLRGDTSSIDAALAKTETRVKAFAGQVDQGMAKTAGAFKGAAGKAAGGLGDIGNALGGLLGKLPGFGIVQAAMSK